MMGLKVTCSGCRTGFKHKSHYLELFAHDSGVVRNFCGRCVNRMHNRLLLKPIKNRDEIELQVYCYNFLKQHKIKYES